MDAMEEDPYSKDICRHGEETDYSNLLRRFTPLSYEEADAILQNVLRACGYKEAHLKKSYVAH